MGKYFKKIAFLDRDGVINKKPHAHQYITKIKNFKFNKDIFELLVTLQKKRYEFIIITNQRGIAKGIFTEKKLNRIHEYMINKLKERGICILDILYCPHEKNNCDCRKPKPGLLNMAFDKYNININDSFFISDNNIDIIMAKKFGLKKSFIIPVNRPYHLLKSLKNKTILL